MPRTFILLCTIALSSMALTGCKKPDQPLPIGNIDKDYDRPLPPGAFALRKIDPSHYPRFGDAWYKAKGTTLRDAVQSSINYLKKPSSKKYYPLGPITHEKAMATLQAFLVTLDQSNSPEALDEAIRRDYDVYMSIGCDDEGAVLFTGYYSPIFNGSKEQTAEYTVPLYRLPPGFTKDSEGNPLGGPYKTRAEIETSQELMGNEIAWLGDRFEAYVFTVQGSGFIRLPDQSLFEIGYAGHNGQDYTPIGRQMVADGKIDKYKLSLDTLIRYFKEHPEDIDTYLHLNKRYVFFQESTGGPYGCLAEKVRPYHSIATDKDIFPRAGLAFVDTRIPDERDHGTKRPFRSFVLDQDRGAAIRAPGRCDIYMGVGEEAGKMAGFTYSEGRLYYLFLKDGVQPQGQMAGQPGAAGSPDASGATMTSSGE